MVLLGIRGVDKILLDISKEIGLVGEEE